MGTEASGSGVDETAFLHHATRSWVVYKIIPPECIESLFVQTMGYHQPKCLAADTLVPEGFGHPVAYLDLFFSNADVAFVVPQVTNAPNHLATLFEFYGPCVIVEKVSTDYLSALLPTFVWRPSRQRPHFGIRGIPKEAFVIAF